MKTMAEVLYTSDVTNLEKGDRVLIDGYVLNNLNRTPVAVVIRIPDGMILHCPIGQLRAVIDTTSMAEDLIQEVGIYEQSIQSR